MEELKAKLADLKAKNRQHQERVESLSVELVKTRRERAEQQPLKSNLALEAATHLTNWLEMDICECEGSHYCGYSEVKWTRDALLVAAEQQSVPDVSALVEALELISDTDPDEGAAWFHEIADKALADYRKAGDQ